MSETEFKCDRMCLCLVGVVGRVRIMILLIGKKEAGISSEGTMNLTSDVYSEPV